MTKGSAPTEVPFREARPEDSAAASFPLLSLLAGAATGAGLAALTSVPGSVAALAPTSARAFSLRRAPPRAGSVKMWTEQEAAAAGYDPAYIQMLEVRCGTLIAACDGDQCPLMPQECVGGECLPLYEYVRQLEELDQMMSGGGQQAYGGQTPYGQQQGRYPPQQGGYPPQGA